jgi:hypothetical protein
LGCKGFKEKVQVVLPFLSKVLLCVSYFMISWCCSFSTCMLFWMVSMHTPKVLVMIIHLTLLSGKDIWRKKVVMKQKEGSIRKAREIQMLTIIIQLHYWNKVLTIVIKLDTNSKE